MIIIIILDYHHCHRHHLDDHSDQECVRAKFKNRVQYGADEELFQSAQKTGDYDDRITLIKR